jgi:ribosome-binding factor A
MEPEDLLDAEAAGPAGNCRGKQQHERHHEAQRKPSQDRQHDAQRPDRVQPQKQEAVMKILEENLRAYRGELGRMVAKQFRIVPELVLQLDTSLDYAQHIEDLLKK